MFQDLDSLVNTHKFLLLSDDPVLFVRSFVHHDLKDGRMHLHELFKVFPLIRRELPFNGGRWGSEFHAFQCFFL